jgi:hypothetical protein
MNVVTQEELERMFPWYDPCEAAQVSGVPMRKLRKMFLAGKVKGRMFGPTTFYEKTDVCRLAQEKQEVV